MPAPLRTQRPLSRTQPVGPVAVKKLPKKHSFQGSRSQTVKKAEGQMPSGNPVGQLAPLDPTAGLQVSEPQNPLDVIGSGPAKSPLGAIPDMKTLMLPAPQQFQSRNPAMSNIAATNYANKNMLQGSMPGGPRAAIPGGYPPGPSASPGVAPAPAAGPPAAPPPILAQQPGLKQGSAAFEFGKAAGGPLDATWSSTDGGGSFQSSMGETYRPGQPQQPLDPKMLAMLSLIAGTGAGIAGAGMGATAGGVMGAGAGAMRGDAVEGLGRGVIRGGLTGAGAGLGAGVGGALGSLTGNRAMADGGAALGGLAGGALGYMGGGALLGKPKGRNKQSAAFEFGKQAYYGSGETPTGPYSGDQAAQARAAMRQGAAGSYNLENNPAHAWLNPFVDGPISAAMNEGIVAPGAASRGSGYTSAAGIPLAAGVVGGVADVLAPGVGNSVGNALATGGQAIHGHYTGATDKARQAFDRDVSPYREAPEPVPGKPKTPGGPFNASQAAKVVGFDDIIASAVRNRKERPAHYFLNPYVNGPIMEMLSRYGRRVAAGQHNSWGGTLSSLPTLGIAPAIMGGKAKQDAARKDYAERVAPYEGKAVAPRKPAAKPATKSEKAEKPKADKPEEKPAEKQSAAFNFGTDIARTMKPKQVTRTTGEYRGADMKTNLHKAGC